MQTIVSEIHDASTDMPLGHPGCRASRRPLRLFTDRARRHRARRRHLRRFRLTSWSTQSGQSRESRQSIPACRIWGNGFQSGATVTFDGSATPAAVESRGTIILTHGAASSSWRDRHRRHQPGRANQPLGEGVYLRRASDEDFQHGIHGRGGADNPCYGVHIQLLRLADSIPSRQVAGKASGGTPRSRRLLHVPADVDGWATFPRSLAVADADRRDVGARDWVPAINVDDASACSHGDRAGRGWQARRGDGAGVGAFGEPHPVPSAQITTVIGSTRPAIPRRVTLFGPPCIQETFGRGRPDAPSGARRQIERRRWQTTRPHPLTEPI